MFSASQQLNQYESDQQWAVFSISPLSREQLCVPNAIQDKAICHSTDVY